MNRGDGRPSFLGTGFTPGQVLAMVAVETAETWEECRAMLVIAHRSHHANTSGGPSVTQDEKGSARILRLVPRPIATTPEGGAL